MAAAVANGPKKRSTFFSLNVKNNFISPFNFLNIQYFKLKVILFFLQS